MATQSDNARKLNIIVNLVGQELRPLNYQKSNRLFNRFQPDGIIHVIDFQMGLNWSILWGKFTVEIGVFLPEVFSALYERKVARFARSLDCIERKRLGALGKEGKDHWWDLTGDLDQIGNDISKLLVGYGERYLSQYNSRLEFISKWEQKRWHSELSQHDVLALAIIYSYLGKIKQANELLTVEFGNQYKTAFLVYARNVVTPLGLSFPPLKY